MSMTDKHLWHKCTAPFFPRRTVEGGWTTSAGQTWCRKINGRWQYRQDEETEADWEDTVI